ncbi:MAG: alpha/beta hydrolase [Thermoplasmata archaeon]|nr:MAG: alpha/beta hydrolase [Thermoplasmata archaeon]
MLVFIHGMWGSADMWKPFINYFGERGFKCKSIELKEGLDLRKTSFIDYVRKVKRIVGENDVVIGHSLGGLIVQKIAEEMKIKGGVAICPAPPRGIKFRKKMVVSSLKYLPKVIMKKPFKPDFSFSRKLFMNCLEEDEAKIAYEKLGEDSAIVAYEITMNKIAVNENKVSCPLLFIATKEDRASPPFIVEKIARKYNAEYKLYDGCHWIFKNWRDIADGIQAFLLNLYK